MKFPALAAACLLALPAFAQAPAPRELVELVEKLPAPPGLTPTKQRTRSGLPLLYRPGAEALRDEPALKPRAKPLFDLYLADAESGDAVARQSVARMYQVGCGVAQSDTNAFNWMRLGAEQGNPDALVGLSTMYMNGNGTARNPQESARWARLAVGTEREASAWLILGILSLTGTTKNIADGLEFWTKAAAQGEPSALLNLSDVYYAGYFGVQRDEERGFELLRRALEIYRRDSGNPRINEASRKLLVQAQVAIREKQFDLASRRLFEARNLQPAAPMAWYNLALVSGEQQKYGDAIYFMQGFLILAPDAPQARGAQDLIYEWQARLKK